MRSSYTINGMLHHPSPFPVAETIDRLVALASAKGLTIFARIDFSRDARNVAMALPQMQLLLLGNPRAGTPLLLASPTCGLDFPLKTLAWQDPMGDVWLSQNTPEYLQCRHNFPKELLPNISSLQLLLEAATKDLPPPNNAIASERC